MVAHAHGRCRAVAVFVHVSQDVYVGTRTAVIGVPLIARDADGVRQPGGDGMDAVFQADGAIGRCFNVTFPSDAAHETAEPIPHGTCTEDVAQESGVMETDVAAGGVLDIVDEVGLGCIAPCVWRIVELQDEVILLQHASRHIAQAGETVHLDVERIFACIEPVQRRLAEGLVCVAFFGDGKNAPGGFGAASVLHKTELQCAPFVALWRVIGILPIHSAAKAVIHDILALDGE